MLQSKNLVTIHVFVGFIVFFFIHASKEKCFKTVQHEEFKSIQYTIFLIRDLFPEIMNVFDLKSTIASVQIEISTYFQELGNSSIPKAI